MYADVLRMENEIMIVNQKHALFEEHFPQFSVLPGAFSIVGCIEGVKKILNKTIDKNYQLQMIQKVSFLKPIKPGMKLMIKVIKVVDSMETKLVIFLLQDDMYQNYLKGILIFGENA